MSRPASPDRCEGTIGTSAHHPAAAGHWDAPRRTLEHLSTRYIREKHDNGYDANRESGGKGHLRL
jgi:hypothetical protein